MKTATRHGYASQTPRVMCVTAATVLHFLQGCKMCNPLAKQFDSSLQG